jgi:putative RNA-binding protein, yhbY family
MTSKQRSYLKGLAMNIDAVLQIGKSSLTDEIIDAIIEVLEARELIKINVLKNCLDDPKEIANEITKHTRSEVVQVIGKKIVLYKEADEPEKRKIKLLK